MAYDWTTDGNLSPFAIKNGGTGKGPTKKSGNISTAPNAQGELGSLLSGLLNNIALEAQNQNNNPGGDGGGGGGGGGGGAAAKAAKDQAARQNAATKSLVEQQMSLLGGFGTQRDTKLGNMGRAYNEADALVLQNYGLSTNSLDGSRSDNEKAEADSSFSNVSNAIRERSDILAEAASQGAGETDSLRAQLAALRNYDSNQNEVNRSFFDTQRSINNAVNSLNSDVGTSRQNMFNQLESDRESAWSNYYNQVADTWTQITNIENANTNVDSEYSIGYKKLQPGSGAEAGKAVGSAYTRQAAPTSLNDWTGKAATEERALTSSNRATTVNLGATQKRPEGATLRKW